MIIRFCKFDRITILSAEQALKLAESPRSRHKLNKERTSAQSVEARIDGGACLSIDIWAKGSESISELIKFIYGCCSFTNHPFVS
uniref:Uncharacterized protein n=1 Tax=Manihot esculenta TaxID=3983 RepID=A0A2C9WND7_MANES